MFKHLALYLRKRAVLPAGSMFLQSSVYAHFFFIVFVTGNSAWLPITKGDNRAGGRLGALSSLRHALSDEFFEILEKVYFWLLFIFSMKLMDFS